MCGRFALYSPKEAITRLFDVELPPITEPRFNIAPSQNILVLRHSPDGSIEPAMPRWGLVPFWAKDQRLGNRLINARSETIHQKPAFRAAFRHRRCVILADGFFEWRRAEERKVPYYVSMKNGEPFAMAGLWERWDGADSPLETCTIITMPASPALAPLHHRMPVILPPDKLRCWIEPASETTMAPREILETGEDDALGYWEVSPEVNNPGNDSPKLIDRYPAILVPGQTDCPGD